MSEESTRKREIWLEGQAEEIVEEKVLITSALPYVNNTPHLGNMIGCVLSADTYARFCRLRGKNTLYICGTDEYGTATETKALQEGLTPKEICDKYFLIHKKVYEWFNINFDSFGRTSTKEHEECCIAIFEKLLENGFAFTDKIQQFFCEKCTRFLADRFLTGICPFCNFDDARGDQCDKCGKLINTIELVEPQCKACGNTPILRESIHYFLDLPKIEPFLKDWIEVSSANWSLNAKRIAESWIKDGLKARCITRDLKWGVPVPVEGFRDKVFYVWFDAPIGYISITKNFTSDWKDWWLPSENSKVSLVQFMGKDNVPFHSVVFPSCLLGTKVPYTIVSKIFATEYLNYEGTKFSKSRGIGVFGTDLFETNIPSDIWRFYLLYIRPESQDSNFSWTDLATKNNSELINNFGNLVNRVLTFLKQKFGSIVPEVNLNESDLEVIDSINKELSSYIQNLSLGKLRDGLRDVLSVSRIGNQYVQNEQPWVLVKSDDTKPRAGSVFNLSCNIVCLLSLLIEPYMPESASRLQSQLNLPESLKRIPSTFCQILKQGHVIGEPSPLFVKIQEADVLEYRKKYSGTL